MKSTICKCDMCGTDLTSNDSFIYNIVFNCDKKHPTYSQTRNFKANKYDLCLICQNEITEYITKKGMPWNRC
jgi:hypothetical protein